MIPRCNCLGCLDVELAQTLSAVEVPRSKKSKSENPGERVKVVVGCEIARRPPQCSGFQWPICRGHHRGWTYRTAQTGSLRLHSSTSQQRGDLLHLLVHGRGRVEDSTLDCHWHQTASRRFFLFDLWQMQSRRDMIRVRWCTKKVFRPDGALLPLTSRIKFSPPLVLEAIFPSRYLLS